MFDTSSEPDLGVTIVATDQPPDQPAITISSGPSYIDEFSLDFDVTIPDKRMVALYLHFPSDGCYQVTGSRGEHKLSFIVEVQGE